MKRIWYVLQGHKYRSFSKGEKWSKARYGAGCRASPHGSEPPVGPVVPTVVDGIMSPDGKMLPPLSSAILGWLSTVKESRKVGISPFVSIIICNDSP